MYTYIDICIHIHLHVHVHMHIHIDLCMFHYIYYTDSDLYIYNIYIYYPLFCKTLHLMMQNPLKPTDVMVQTHGFPVEKPQARCARLLRGPRPAGQRDPERQHRGPGGAPGRAIGAKTGPGNLWKSPWILWKKICWTYMEVSMVIGLPPDIILILMGFSPDHPAIGVPP